MGLLTGGHSCNSSEPDWNRIKRVATSIVTDVAHQMEWIMDHLEGSSEKTQEKYLSGCLGEFSKSLDV